MTSGKSHIQLLVCARCSTQVVHGEESVQEEKDSSWRSRILECPRGPRRQSPLGMWMNSVRHYRKVKWNWIGRNCITNSLWRVPFGRL